MIKNIIIEPSSTSQHFIVYGESQNKKGQKFGVVVGLNFGSLHEPQCRNPEEPDTEHSDYEKWSPSDGKDGHLCLMGHKTIYVRKKREAECYNGINFERKSIIENCTCTDDDYECDEGFTRTDSSEPCTPIEPTQHKVPTEGEVHQPPADCKGYFTISKGYRKIPDNTCINGVKYDPIIIPCPYSGLFSSLGMVFFLLILIIVVILVALAFNKSFLNDVSEFVMTKMEKPAPVTNKPDYLNIVY